MHPFRESFDGTPVDRIGKRGAVSTQELPHTFQQNVYRPDFLCFKRESQAIRHSVEKNAAAIWGINFRGATLESRNCRGGPPWPPLSGTNNRVTWSDTIRTPFCGSLIGRQRNPYARAATEGRPYSSCEQSSKAVDALSFDRALCEVAARFNQRAEAGETRIARQSFLITKIDLLHDHCDL